MYTIEIVLVALKVWVVLGFLYVTYLLRQVVLTGIRTRKMSTVVEKTELTKTHRQLARHAYAMTIAAIAVTELMVRVAGGSHLDDLLIRHILADGFFLVLFTVSVFWVTGIRDVNTHRAIVYATVVVYAVVLVTGFELLFKPFFT